MLRSFSLVAREEGAMFPRRILAAIFVLLLVTCVPLWAQTPVAPTLVSPADLAVDVAVLTNFNWNAVEGAGSYRLQVSTDPSFGSTAADVQGLTGTSYTLASALANSTQYYWRMNSTQGEQVSEWSTIWSFTTIAVPTPPPVPTLASPANGAVDVPVLTPFTWNASEGAESYALQVASDAGFGSIVFQTGSIAGTGYTLTTPLANSTQYYWRVNAQKGGLVSDWSAGWSFTTIMPLPSPPTTTSPAANATGVPNPPTFTWTAGALAQAYELQISLDNTFVTEALVVNQSGIPGTSLTLSERIDGGRKQYWRVRSVNVAGASNWAPSAQGQAFTTILEVPIEVLLYSPSNGATGQTPGLLPYMWYESTDNPATSWRLQVAKDVNFTTVVDDRAGLTGPQALASGLQNSTTYYWHVNGSNSVGTGPWSETWQFTTTYVTPAVPTLVSPANSAVNVPLSPAFTWNSVQGAQTYGLQVSTSNTFGSYVVNQTGISATTFTPPSSLAQGTIYYWRVNATNPSGTSNWASAWSFTTIPNAPAAPTLAAASGITNSSFTVNWSAVSGASGYKIDVALDAGFTTILSGYNNKDVGNVVQAPVTGLTGGTVYHFRVRAYNGGGESESSAPGNVLLTPDAPVAGEATSILDISFVANWSKTLSAQGYCLDVATDEGFTTFVAGCQNKEMGDVDNALIEGLTAAQHYYYRVRAHNTSGTSPNSQTIQLVTLDAPLPIQLSSFSAQPNPKGAGVRLDWTTASEIDNYGFYVQRMGSNETTFADVENGFLPGAGTTLKPQSYVYVDVDIHAAGTYHYRLRQVDRDTRVHFSDEVTVSLSVLGVVELAPKEFKLDQNYPNPFNPETTIRFSLDRTVDARLEVFDICGRSVGVLFEGKAEAGRYYYVVFKGANLSSGLYFYKLSDAQQISLKRMVLLR